jgi:flagellar biosynthesis regulator FlaF
MIKDSTATLDKKDSKTNDSEARSLSAKVWSILASDLQNPDSKHYAQSVLKRAMEIKND